MPSLQTTFISVSLIWSSQDLEKQALPCLPWRKNSGSQQPGACSWCSPGQRHAKPLISCPGFLLSTKALIPTSYKCPVAASMKYRLFLGLFTSDSGKIWETLVTSFFFSHVPVKKWLSAGLLLRALEAIQSCHCVSIWHVFRNLFAAL